MMSELDGYKFSGVYSNTFADDTFGVLVGVVFAEREDRTDIAGNDGGWTRNPDPNDESWLWGNAWGGNIDPTATAELDEDEYGLIGPGQFRVGSILEEKKRRAFTAKLEWRPSDNVKIVADGLKTRLDSPQVGYQQSYYPLFAPGPLVGFQHRGRHRHRLHDGQCRSGTRAESRAAQHDEHRVVDTDLYGLNGEWEVNECAHAHGRCVSLDVQALLGRAGHLRRAAHEPAEYRRTFQLGGAAVPNVTVNFDDGRELTNGLASGEFGGSDFNTHYMELRGDNIEDEITGAHDRRQTRLSTKSASRRCSSASRPPSAKKSRDLVNNTLNGGADYYSGEQRYQRRRPRRRRDLAFVPSAELHERRERGFPAHLPGVRRSHLPGSTRSLRWQCAARRAAPTTSRTPRPRGIRSRATA